MTPQEAASQFILVAQSVYTFSQSDYELYLSELVAQGHNANDQDTQGRRPCPPTQSTSTGAQG